MEQEPNDQCIPVTTDGLVTKTVLCRGEGETPPLHARCLGESTAVALCGVSARELGSWPRRLALANLMLQLSSVTVQCITSAVRLVGLL